MTRWNHEVSSSCVCRGHESRNPRDVGKVYRSFVPPDRRTSHLTRIVHLARIKPARATTDGSLETRRHILTRT
jgi:hypothetical protein